MPFNLLGPNEAIEALRREVETERAKDPSFPWTVVDHWEEGSILAGDDDLTGRNRPEDGVVTAGQSAGAHAPGSSSSIAFAG